MFDSRPLLCVAAIASTCAVNAVLAEENSDAPITAILETLPEDVRMFNDHLTTLANPAMEGRLPGTKGMEMAKSYCEYWFDHYGLEPAFPQDGAAFASWRQPFALGGSVELANEALSVEGSEGSLSMIPGRDFKATPLGGSGEITATPVFVGYSIDNGPQGFSSYGEDDDLTGKVAVMFRFEPMDEAGESLWANSGWSRSAGFFNKIRAARDRNAAAIIVINPPECSDPRSKNLGSISSTGSGRGTPVFGMTPEAGERLVAACDPAGRTLIEMRRLADEGGGAIALDGEISLGVETVRDELYGENVGGLIRGRGALADEVIVIGAHLDHLGMGEFGSRTGAGRLHPGADDNASGSAAILILAQKLSDSYAQLDDGQDARSILLMCFDAEESGLNGSRHYVENPILPIEDHVLMVNFDMIGRILEGRLSVSGVNTGEGMADWLQPFFDASPLDVITPRRMSGASDHTSFHRKGMPILFGIIADFHDDYHTPADVSYKINRVSATHVCRLFHEISFAYATRPDRFPFQGAGASATANAGPRRSEIKVRFGIAPGSYDEGEKGVLVSEVFENTSASEGGVLAGDVLIKWQKDPIDDVMDWMGKLGEHEPGDEVQVVVLRDGEEITLFITLMGRESTDG